MPQRSTGSGATGMSRSAAGYSAPMKPRYDRRRLAPGDAPTPIYVVWELTLRCDQPCAHCGSRAGHSRPRELDTDECLVVVDQIAALGTREVTLIGGEAYLRPDLYTIIGRLVDRGVVVTMQTGGRALTATRARKLKALGVYAIGVSIDGPEDTHDRLRGNAGSWQAAVRALDHCAEVGMTTTSNSQVNGLTWNRLEETAAFLRDHQVRAWRAQMTVPMGNAADHPEWILPPHRVVDVLDTLAAIQIDAVRNPRPHELPHPQRSFDVQIGNNLGYFGPHEELLRSHPGGRSAHWGACQAGIAVMSIESDGTIKACPSLPTAPYAGGNVLALPLAEAWRDAPALRFARDRDGSDLWGFCKTCYYADICQAGCNFTTHSAFGRRGNNPWCYHRVTTLARQGRRERLVQVEAAAGLPYDFGRFEIVEEALVEDPGGPGLSGSR